MLLGFTTKLKLNNKQRMIMAQHAGYNRWLYNHALAWWSFAYKEGLKPTANKLKKFYTNCIKPQYEWQSSLSSRVYQYCFQDLDSAFKKFFNKAGYPKFKKRGKDDRFTLDNCGKLILLGGVKTKLPFIGWVSTFEPLPDCQTKKVTISYHSGDWYISFAYEQQRQIPTKTETGVGVDLGIKTLATLSNGKVFANLQAYRLAERRRQRLQRCLSRKQKGSKNRNIAKLRVAKSHQRVANIRKDYLHKITSYLAKTFKRVVIEDLNVKGMLSNSKLAKSIADNGLYEFRRQLEYKCQLYGTELVIADRWFPSSKTCSNCGEAKDSLSLSERVFCCDICNFEIDRDINAAINLSNWGRLDPGSLLRDSRSHAPVEAGRNL